MADDGRVRIDHALLTGMVTIRELVLLHSQQHVAIDQ